MKTLTAMRVIGSITVIAAYFVVLHVNLTAGVVMNVIADTISIPYFVKTKSWDIVAMLGFLLAISFSKLLS
jgi:predicted signal transduction protein with EAL and GGDEF domain